MKLAAANNFNSLEKPKQFALLRAPFSIEADLLTPTMKLKRNVARKLFENEVKYLYSIDTM